MKFALILYFAVMCLKKSYSQSCVVGGHCTHGFIPGTYKLDNQCSYFKRLHSEETYTHTWCGFDGERAIICCPEDGVSVRSSHDEVYDEQQTMESLCKSFKIAPVTSSIRIFGGTESLTGEFPHFTLLGYRKATGGKTSFDCGGTLISSKHVLTAAHCCRNSSGLSFVRLGATTIDNEEDGHLDVDITKVTIHPNYKSSNIYHDIAVIELETAVDFNPSILPACLSRDFQEEPYKKLTIAGFGRTNVIDRTETSNSLMKGGVEEIPLTECRQRYDRAYSDRLIPKLPNGITDDFMCATNRTATVDTCEGDSGSGLMSREGSNFIAVAVTSYGIGCGTSLPPVYIRVSRYIDWIETIVTTSFPI